MKLNWFIVLVFFYDALVFLLLPSTATFILASDGSTARYVVNLSALGIGLSVLCKSGFQPLKNQWFAWLVIFMVFSAAHSPDIRIESTFIPKDSGLFNFKPMFESLVFLLMLCGVQSININIEKVFKTIVGIACIYSLYIIIQSFGLDQIYHIVGDRNTLSRNPELGGFISQPVFAGIFLAMCLPFAVKLKKYWFVALIIVGICATQNRTAMIAGVIGCLAMLIKKEHVYILVGTYILAIVVSFILNTCGISPILHDTGRFGTWGMILADIAKPLFPGVDKFNILTGQGIGSFSVLYPFYHNSGWLQAHNEFLEIFYGLSFVGLGLLILAISKALDGIRSNVIFAALIVITVASFTNAVWHIAQLQFMTVLLAGLGLNAPLNQGDEYGRTA
jgi:hypothetical protein